MPYKEGRFVKGLDTPEKLFEFYRAAENKTVRVEITPALRHYLHSERDRTGVGAIALLKNRENVPRGLSHQTVAKYSYELKSARLDYLAYVLYSYVRLPDKQIGHKQPLKGDTSRIRITDEIRKRLAIKHAALPKKYLQHSPVPFSTTQMAHALHGRLKTMPEAVLDYIESVTVEDVLKMNRQQEELSADDNASLLLLDLLHPELWPSFEGLPCKKSLDTPEKVFAFYHFAQNKKQRVKLTAKIHSHLRRERDRTGIGGTALLGDIKDVPGKPKDYIINTWLSRGGNCKTARLDYLALVLYEYMQLPDGQKNKKRPLTNDASRIQVTDDIRERLAIRHASLPKNYLRYSPEPFTSAQMGHVLSGRDKTMPGAVFRFIENVSFHEVNEVDREKALQSSNGAHARLLPDLIRSEMPPIPERAQRRTYAIRQYANSDYIEITESLYFKLHAEQSRTCVSFKRVIDQSDDVPDGLNKGLVSGWYRGVTMTAERHYVDFILEAYARLPDAHLK